MINKYENDIYVMLFIGYFIKLSPQRAFYCISIYILLSYIVIKLLSYIDLLDLILSYNIIVDHNSDKIN